MPTTLNKEEFIRRSILSHGDRYDYSNVIYKNQHITVIINCPIHGDFLQIPKSHMLGHGCKKCMAENFKKSYTGVKKINKLDGNIVIKKLKLIYKDYNYDDCYISGSRQTAKINNIICPIHGYFNKRLSNHLRQGQGCNLCGSNKLSQEYFIKRSNIIHQNKYDYSIVNYQDNRIKVEIICPEHGKFMQSPSKHLSGQGCPICYQTISSKGESFIRKYLIKNSIEFESQKIIPGTKLKMDFYLPKYNICIEYDGIQHSEPRSIFGGQEEYDRQIKRDSDKNKYCLDNNISIIRIGYKDYNKMDSILSKITNENKSTHIKKFNSM